MPGDAQLQQATLAALEPGQCLTVDDLAERSRLPNRTIVKSVARLIRRGFARRVEAGCFELTREGELAKASGKRLKSGPRAPLSQTCRRRREPTFRERLWRALRIKNKATIGDLVELAAQESDKDPTSNATRYLAALHNAGYLRRLRREKGTAPTSNGFVRYQLANDSGPEAPIVQRAGAQVFDPNKGKVVWTKGVPQ